MSFSSDHAIAIAEILRRAAHAEILPRFRNLAADAIRYKSSVRDLVTDADEAAERVIEAEILKLFPNAIVVGEEATARDPSLPRKLDDAALAFIVDPVDGTKNFSSGLPLFGSMVAVAVKGEAVAGIIHDPIGGDWAIAVKGEGAWIEHADHRRTALRVSAPVPVSEMEGCVSWAYMSEPLRSVFPARLPRVAIAMNYRCAAHEYRMAASGHCHFLLYSKIMPWDHAAGLLLYREAGGYSAHFDGSPYRLTNLDGGLLCAPDVASWEALKESLLS
ncbi:inositol monophosphatase family protein [Microvirga sp. 2MCAF38]|uniref:inositol monophosphatase family protein n=1 Tax=Microvirga sp. 2MCAF38 TaxID=3232989 RepID=UPI003F997818